MKYRYQVPGTGLWYRIFNQREYSLPGATMHTCLLAVLFGSSLSSVLSIILENTSDANRYHAVLAHGDEPQPTSKMTTVPVPVV